MDVVSDAEGGAAVAGAADGELAIFLGDADSTKQNHPVDLAIAFMRECGEFSKSLQLMVKTQQPLNRVVRKLWQMFMSDRLSESLIMKENSVSDQIEVIVNMFHIALFDAQACPSLAVKLARLVFESLPEETEAELKKLCSSNEPSLRKLKNLPWQNPKDLEGMLMVRTFYTEQCILETIEFFNGHHSQPEVIALLEKSCAFLRDNRDEIAAADVLKDSKQQWVSMWRRLIMGATDILEQAPADRFWDGHLASLNLKAKSMSQKVLVEELKARRLNKYS